MASVIYPRRFLAAALTLLFGALNASFSLFELDKYTDPLVAVALGLLYFSTLVISVGGVKSLRLPLWKTLLATTVAVSLPILTQLQLSSPSVANKGTWYVTAIAILLSVLAVRGRLNFAIVGSVVFFAETLYFVRLEGLPNSGITGALILIVASAAISRGLESSMIQIREAQLALVAKKERTTFREAVAEEFDLAFGKIQDGVIPTLKRVASGKHFSKADRETYQLLEDELRDVISGRLLINPRMKLAVQKARQRGVDVALLDEGGLESLRQVELDELIDIIVETLSEISIGRVTIRSQPEEAWLIRMTASRPRMVTPDLDLKLGER